MEKIYYVGMYDTLHYGKKIRSYSLAEAKKMDFICKSIENLGYDVEIISAAYINNKDCPYIKKETVELSKKAKLILPSSWGAKNKISRIARVLFSLWSIFGYLVKHCGKGQTVIVYHNYFYAVPVILAQKIKKFNLILEIEEQYSMVWQLTAWQRLKEEKLLHYGKLGGLVVSEVLAQKLGIQNPIISYGNYDIYQGFVDKKGYRNYITLVYSGSIDKTKNSAYKAVKIMQYLPENYILKISGYIENSEEELFKNAINHMNQICGRNACEYMGMLDDDAYEDLLLNADIALNLQQDGEFGTFLFPSKILTYLSYNLDVVTTGGESIVHSNVADILHISKDYTDEEIVRAIRNVNFERSYDYRDRLEELSANFQEQLRKLLSQLELRNGTRKEKM